jgi:flagellar FliL protein
MSTAAEGLEGVAAAAGEGAKAKKGSKLPLIIALVVVLAAAGGAAWYFGLLPGSTAKEPEGEAHASATAAEGEHGKGGGKGASVGSMRPLDPFLANLADETSSRYLKMSLQVEFVDADPPAAFDARLPQIRDVILTLVTSKTFADIRTPEGKERLREDVIDRINHVLAKEAVKSVYFTEFIVQ